MNVYILTFHSAHNYGAVFQAFALQYYLKSICNNGIVACIDYKPAFITYHLLHNRNGENVIKWCFHNLLVLPSRMKRKNGFEQFIKKNINTIAIDSAMKSKEAVLIAGSDQIWNKDITGGALDDMYFFLSFASHKRYSYAASIGSNKTERIIEITKKIESFISIGVREKDIADTMFNLGLSNTYHNIDPVFLVEKSKYYQISVRPKLSNYIFIYTLETSIEEVKRKIAIAKQLYPHSKIVSLGSFRNIYQSDIHLNTATPEEYLGLIQNATAVITNSFHVTAFCIIFNIPMAYVPLKNGREGRILSLLSLVKYYKDFDEYSRIELNELINESEMYLKNIIKNAS